MEASGSSSREKRKYCGHCDDYVALKTYRCHEKLYYISAEARWKKCDDISSDEEISTSSQNNDHELNINSSVNDSHTQGTLTNNSWS